MTTRFRPQVERLEEIAVPASLSYQFPNGTVGSGLFSTPEGVDPAQSYQSLPLDDLSVTQGGVAFAVQPGATATYQRGSLVGVNATATSGSDTLQFANYMVVENNQDSANIQYDGTVTAATVTLPDGTTGAMSYSVPWDQVDGTQASQTLPLSGFNLNIAGQNINEATVGFTTAPSAQFANGVFVGLTFTADTSLLTNFPYSSISMAGGLGVTAELVGGGMLTANAAPQVYTATLDFSGITIPAAGQTYKMRVQIECSDPFKAIDLTIAIGNNTTPADVISTIKASLIANGYYNDVVGNKLTIGNPEKTVLQTVTITSYTKTDNNGLPIPDKTLKGPKLTALAGSPTIVPEVKYNGDTLSP